MNCAMEQAFDLVMFDLDGTLVATAPEIHDAVNDTLRRFDLPPVDQSRVEAWIGNGTMELLVEAIAFASNSSTAVVRGSEGFVLACNEFSRHYRQRCGTRSRLYPHVLEVLTALRQRGVKLAVVTNKEERFTHIVLDAHGLDTLIDRVVAGDSLPTKKPDPAGLLSCLATFDVPPARALFVGDSAIDVAAARNAGLRIWAVPYGYNMGVPIESERPDRLIDDLRPLLTPATEPTAQL